LEELQRTSGRLGFIVCPECRTELRIPGSGNPNELPTNFRLNRLLDVLAIQECSTTGAKCGNCDKKSVQCSYCFQCCAFWCEDCITAHNIIRANKDHRVLALKDFQDQDIEDVLKRPAFCQKTHHENEGLKFFCKDCEVAICNTCVVTLHGGHAMIPLNEAANERKLRVNSLIETKKQEALQKKTKIIKLQNERIKIQAQVASVEKKAQSFVDDMMKIIEAKKHKIFKEVKDQAKECLERLKTKQCEVERELQRIETAIQKTETLVKRSTSAEMVQLDTKFLEEVCDEREQAYSNFEELGCCIFVQNNTLMNEASLEGIGSIETFCSKTKGRQSSAEGKGTSEATVGLEALLVLTTRNAEEERCYEEFDCVTVEIRNDQGDDCATETKVQDNKDGTYKISYFAKETGTFQASVMVNGEQVRGSPFTVQVKARQYKPALSFGQFGLSVGMFYRPWGVAVNERNEIAVTDVCNRRVQLYSSDGTFLRSFGSKGDQEGEFMEPRGIAFLNNENIVVADRSNHRVQIFSEQGEYLSQFGEKGNYLDHQFNLPWGLSVDSDGNIIVADSGNKLIKIFSRSGQFKRQFGGGGEGCLVDPRHCVQKDKYFIVSDTGDNCVKVFDVEGNFLYKFGEYEEGEGELAAPRCLSVDKAGHLLVCDYENNNIQVFELSGKFITRFGRNGREIGEFRKPTSTAVITDGRIVVCDFYNNRIQIFE